MDGAGESVGIGEGMIGEIMLLEVAPASLDVIQPQLRIRLEMFSVEGDGRLPGSEGVSDQAGENMDYGVHG